MSDEHPWLPLKEAAARWQRSGIWSDALNDVLRSGRVPVRGKRSGYAADPMEELLRRLSRPPAPRDPLDRLAAGDPASRVSFWPALNQIILRPDSWLLRNDRELAAELGDEFAGQIPGILPLSITFTDVVVHWPKLVEELQAAGFRIRLPRRKPASSIAVASQPAADNHLPRARLRDDELRSWFDERVKKGVPTSAEDDWKDAQNKFGEKARRDQVRSMRRDRVPTHWRKQGRRPKSCG